MGITLTTSGFYDGWESFTTEGIGYIGPVPCPSAEDFLQLQLDWLPPEYVVWTPVLAGRATVAELAVCTAANLANESQIGGATDTFLDLLARNYGVRRAPGESDPELRFRMRNAEDKVTPAAILAACDEIFSSYTAETCVLIEHWDNGVACDVEPPDPFCACDVSTLYDKHNAITIEVPDLGDVTHQAYSIAINEVNRIKAAGVCAFLLIRGT